MLANYGYRDGSGEYFITIDTDLCIECDEHGCATACPSDVLEIIVDDYDDKVAAVTEEQRKKIKYACAPCKPTGGRDRPEAPTEPCLKACPHGAMKHSF